MKLTSGSAPHIRDPITSSQLMGHVVLALLPPLAVGVWQLGLGALWVALSCAAASVAVQAFFGGVKSVRDGSAAVTGLLLAMTLPPRVPLWLAAAGGAFAIAVGKLLCGGSVGEISALAILVGGGYLLWRRVISWHIPLSLLSSAAVLTLLFARGDTPLLWMLSQLLSGGLMLAAFFMATDYATSPVTPRGQLIYGALCGALTVLFRYVGIFPEGVTYAILLMNSLAWSIDRLTPPRRFGAQKGAKA